MRLFAYPVGLPSAFDGATRSLVKAAGVALAFSLYGGYVRPGRLDAWDVPRASVGGTVNPRALRAIATLPQVFASW
jgi:hypothetical protein